MLIFLFRPEIKPEPTDEIETEKILGGLSDAPEYKQPNDIATMSPLFNANSNNSHKGEKILDVIQLLEKSKIAAFATTF